MLQIGLTVSPTRITVPLKGIMMPATRPAIEGTGVTLLATGIKFKLPHCPKSSLENI